MPGTRASDGDARTPDAGPLDPPRARRQVDPDRSVRSKGGLVLAGLLVLAVLMWFAASTGAKKAIHVEVVDTDGQPVVGVDVEAVRSEGAPEHLGDASRVSAVTDAQGRATLGGIRPGDTIHVARRPEWPDMPELPNLPADVLGRPTNTAFDYVLDLFQTPSGRW
ncbi:MAG TPA: carboxypeptidase-like regulatory domain-containing protein, partial [Planctomycetota bacterium]|nr:carboxypeptidase-like regulatory domain-containing protein [Planctomycetota bacterium]